MKSLRLPDEKIGWLMNRSGWHIKSPSHLKVIKSVCDAQDKYTREHLADMGKEEIAEMIENELANYSSAILAWKSWGTMATQRAHELKITSKNYILALFQAQKIKAMEEAKKENQKILTKAVNLIKSWHNLGAFPKIPQEQVDKMWQIYYDHAPEMREIRQALKANG